MIYIAGTPDTLLGLYYCCCCWHWCQCIDDDDDVSAYKPKWAVSLTVTMSNLSSQD